MQRDQAHRRRRDNVFSFSYRDTEPDAAQARGAETLVSLFVESDLGAKQRDTEAARTFIDEQIKTYEARLTEAENQAQGVQAAQPRHARGTGQGLLRADVGADRRAEQAVELDLRAAEQSRDALKRELARRDR